MTFNEHMATIIEDESLNLLVAEGRAQTKKVILLQLLDRKQTLIRKRLRRLITARELQDELSMLTPQITIALRQYRYANRLLDQHIEFAKTVSYMSTAINE